MPPTTLLADPAVWLAGARRRYVDAPASASRPRSRMRWGWPALAALVLIAAGLIGFLGTWPPLATVMSGSMAPTINTGDMVLLKRLDRPARTGDVVVISVPDAARGRFGYPPVVIHRIVGVAADGAVTTKGDAHKEPDPFTVPRATLTTGVVATVPAGGRVLAFLGSGLGMLWLAGGALLFLGMPLLDRYRDGQRRGLDERDDLHSALQSVTDELTQLRAQIERAVAAVPLPPPPVWGGEPRCVPASQWRPPTPDLMAALRPPPATSALGAWDAPPQRRFEPRAQAVQFAV
jgi:signal peptidase I